MTSGRSDARFCELWALRREIKALRALSHRNVVQIFDGGTTDDGRRFYAMELLDGPRRSMAAI
jgi:serine/threonine protein kinase